MSSRHTFWPHLHWEMVSWLSRTWYMTDCTFQCCRSGYPDTSLKFTIPARDRTRCSAPLSTAARRGDTKEGAVPCAMPGAVHPAGWEGGMESTSTHHVPAISCSAAIKIMALKEK